MTLADITAMFQERAGNAANIGKTLKIVFDEGPVFLDMTSDQAQITNDDKDADCTITTTIDVLKDLAEGNLNPTMALMTGKLKLKGDMSVALKLQSLLGK